jgi:hypothetical protein
VGFLLRVHTIFNTLLNADNDELILNTAVDKANATNAP